MEAEDETLTIKVEIAGFDCQVFLNKAGGLKILVIGDYVPRRLV